LTNLIDFAGLSKLFCNHVVIVPFSQICNQFWENDPLAGNHVFYGKKYWHHSAGQYKLENGQCLAIQ